VASFAYGWLDAPKPIDKLKIPVESVLTPLVLDLNLPVMGDKSPKATHKQQAQKQAKTNASNQKKNSSASSKQVPKPK
jgi:hypothetical protein